MPYCCGSAPGVDDIMRFLVLQILFVNLGELWGFDKPPYARLPHMRRWLLAMRGRDSNPFKHVHEDELYYRAHREWWTKKMPQRLFPSCGAWSVEEEVARLRMKSSVEEEVARRQWGISRRSSFGGACVCAVRHEASSVCGAVRA